jgi:hypothetical protein
MDWELFESRVDWITATARTDGKGTRLLNYGAELLEEERERGNFARATSFEGYRGTQSKHAFVGYRVDGTCIRLGGELARDRWADVYGRSQNVSRLDLAVTGKGLPPTLTLAVEGWNGLPQRSQGEGRQTEYTLIQTRGRGDTLYCGSRSSARFGRLYNKSAQDPVDYPEGCWRWEVEYKRENADAVVDQLATARHIEAAIAGLVSNRFADWGVPMPFAVDPTDFSDKGHRKLTDDESRYRWLREQVSLSVDRLKQHYSIEELRRALGVDDAPPEGSVREALTTMSSMGRWRRPSGIYPTVSRRLRDAEIQAELDRE